MSHSNSTRRPSVRRRPAGRVAPRVATLDGLEPRKLMAAVYPTAFEQYMVELINRARANPAAEAARLNGYNDSNGNTFPGNLNEGLSAGTISTSAKQPLAINPNLTDAARTHAQWLLSSNTFGHSGSGGSQPAGRMAAAGYSGATGTRENLGIDGNSVLPNDTQLIEDQHAGLFTDMSVGGRGHRLNLMANDVREVGSGVAKGSFNYASWGLPMTLPSIVTAQDFAIAAGNPFLTGVAYTDAVRNDDFYTPGEGLGGITIKAKSGGTTYTTTTWDSGGYALALPAGTYTVTATGGALGSKVATYSNVIIGSENVKRDFLPEQAVNAGPEVTGPVTDVIAIAQNGSPYRSVTLTFNGNLGSSVSKDDFVLQRRKDRREVAGSYWKFSSGVDGNGRTTITARVTKAELQGKYQIVVKEGSVTAASHAALDHVVTLSFFLEPTTVGATSTSGFVLGTFKTTLWTTSSTTDSTLANDVLT